MSVPAMVGAYRLGARLGGGGFGEVFAGTHEAIGGDVAIKILHAERCTDAAAVRRFLDEARAVNRIHHPAIVDIVDFGTLADGRAYCVMERLYGRTLRERLEAGPLERGEAVALLGEIAAAIDAAHAVGIAHRDLKPENIFVRDDGSIVLFDFGLAKLSGEIGVTQSGAVLGTPRYMAPEQCRGDPSDARADLYAFGALAYELLVGAPVFAGDPLALALAHLNEAPVPPSRRAHDLPPGTDEVLLALLAKSPNRRPAPLVDAIARLAGRPSRKHRWWWVLAVPAVALLVRFAACAHAAAVDPHAITTYRIAAAPAARALPSGRRVVSDDATETIAIDGRAPFPGRLGEPSPCDERVAYVVDGVALRSIDADTGAITELGPVTDRGARWSPDCRRLVWATRDGQLRTTDAETGAVARIPSYTPVFGSPGWLGDDGIVYGRPNEPLMIHDLATGEDVPLAPYIVGVYDYAIASDGARRAIVTAAVTYDMVVAMVLDPRDPHPTPLDRGLGSLMVSTAFDRGAVVLRPIGAVPRLLRLLDDGTQEKLTECPNVRAVVARAGEVLQVALDGAELSVFGAGCGTFGRYDLPAGRVWSDVSCGGTRCAIAAIAGDLVEVYELAETLHLVTTFAEDPRSRGTPPVIAVSPDGVRAVAHRRESSRYAVVRFDGSPPDVVRLGGAFPRLGGLAWAPDGEHFFADAQHIDGEPNAIARFDLARHHDLTYRAGDTALRLWTAAPDGRLVVVPIPLKREVYELR